MPVQAIAPAAAGDPGDDLLTADHPLAALAARTCLASGHVMAPALAGGVACGSCWATVLVNDLVFALEHGLPIDLVPDPSYIDEVAVRRAMRGERLELTEVERAEVRRRLDEVRTRRNGANRFACSRAAAARREAQR